MKISPSRFLLLLLCAATQTALARTITVHSAADSGPGSLRQALADAANGDTININAKLTIYLTSGELVVGKNLMIKGPGANGPTISGNNTSRVFHIMPGTTVTLDGMAITNGAASNDLNSFPANAGGGIYSDHAKLTISNCTISDNSAAIGGGILSNVENGNNGSLSVNNTTLRNNSAVFGGGILNDGEFGNATMTLSKSVFTGNSATVLGGGIYNDAEFGKTRNIIINCQFIANAAATDPGTHFFRGAAAIFNDGYSGSAVLDIDESVFRENNGGHDFVFGFGPSLCSAAIWNHGYYGNAALTMNNCDLNHNSTQPGFVGGIFNYGEGGTATMTLASSTIRNHELVGIGNWAATAAIKSCIINGNVGGIDNNGTLNLADSKISGNSTDFGGGIEHSGYLTATDSTINNNSAQVAGGGIHLSAGGTVELTNCTISGNSAGSGGAILTQSGGSAENVATVILTNCTVSGNTSAISSNAIANYSDVGAAVLILNHDTFTGNLGGNLAIQNVSLHPTQGVATTEISNTILNTEGTTGTIFNQGGTIISHGYNLCSDTADGGAGTSPGGLLNGPGDIRNTNPLLGPLKDNGGPTMTHELRDHSPAINAGDPNFNPHLFSPSLLYDQRGPGFPRIVGGRVDIGAFETKSH